MQNNTLNEGQAGVPKEVLKLTALSYLREALQREEYERCADLAADARYFGATEEEIRAAIASYKQVDQAGANNEAKGKNRLRSLLKE